MEAHLQLSNWALQHYYLSYNACVIKWAVRPQTHRRSNDNDDIYLLLFLHIYKMFEGSVASISSNM